MPEGNKKRGRPRKENLLEGLTNLDTGEPAPENTNLYFPSMKAAAHALKIDIAILKDARSRDCPAFRTGGNVHREQLIKWLREDAERQHPAAAAEEATASTEEEYIENYDLPDEAGGVGQTLKSLQMYERRAKRKLDELEKSNKLHPSIKAELVKQAQDAWLKVVNALLKYDLSVSQAKRESGELIPIADAVAGVQALLAWHTVGTSDGLRNAIPRCEKQDKYSIAAILDPVLRSAIYRNFKLGVKLGKIPEWMGKTASEFISQEKPFTLDDKPPEKPPVNLDEY